MNDKLPSKEELLVLLHECVWRTAQHDSTRPMQKEAEGVVENLYDELKRRQERIAELERVDRRFPILNGPSIPWYVIAPFESQAIRNHNQTLERLAQRGGRSD